ncbi:Rid family detoxifying hydrolase [Candidatus Bipolaricaulota bacterium]|nr:Rid family detoxifying hydrolase [Candidatus Bipolaricaulota bacterium]
MTKLQLHTDDAPAAVGPYSQGISVGRLVLTSGQLPMKNGVLITDDVAKAARASLENVAAVLKVGHAALSDVVKVTIFLKDMDDFPAVNAVYGEFFPQPYPARSCIEVARLPLDAILEIEAIAHIQ